MPPLVRRLQLTDFRSYPALDLRLTDQAVVLAGDNGAGKTNILEALSFLTPGRGLRRAEAAACARRDASGGWAVSADVAGRHGAVQMGTGLDPATSDAPPARRYRIDREAIPSARGFATHLSLVWLVPAMDGLFGGPAGERRRFLDRLVLSLDPDHGARVAAYERALRSRNRLLDDGADARWLDATEREAAGLAVAVAAARTTLVRHLQGVLAAAADDAAAFPWAEVALEGAVEDLVARHAALEVEDQVRRIFRDGRARDAAARRTLYGPQTSDLIVRHGPTATDAARASTGEQKALLVGLTLAHTRLLAALGDAGLLLLLDEVAAHFDRRRRVALFDILGTLPAQVWMTGAERALFTELDGRAQFVAVRTGEARTEA